MSTSHLLTQTRDVLYSGMQNPAQNLCVLQAQPNCSMADVTQVNIAGQNMGQHAYQQSHLEANKYQQTSNTMNSVDPVNSMNESGTIAGPYQNNINAGVPLWVPQLFKGLDIRLNQIEAHLINQNTRWQSVSDTLRIQNHRMTNIEANMADITSLKQNTTGMKNKMVCHDQDLSEINRKVRDHDESIQTFSEMLDDVQSDKRTQNSEIAELRAHVDQLQLDNDDMKDQLSKAESTIVDLQCRSMRDNLIFTGIEEPAFHPDQPEDTENSLRKFLQTEMQIYEPIQFHRVHRLGRIDRHDDNPRPIIAKFERAKKREQVRGKAPKTLTGKPFGVREQFPKAVEDRRKLLYPEMKRAKENKSNKVRLVRDRLFINNSEYLPTENITEQQNENRSNYQARKHEKQARWDYTYQSVRGQGKPQQNGRSRVFTRSNMRSQYDKRSHRMLDFTLPPTSNRPDMPLNNDRTESRKKKASSPVDSDQTLKKYREQQRLDEENSQNASYEMIELACAERIDSP